MEIKFNELNNGINAIKLCGRLDIIGTGEIETRFAGYCSGERTRVIVDLSEVEYLASIGIRLLIVNAKSVVSRRGKMVLLNPNPQTMNVLELAGIPEIIPVYSHLESAEAVLLGL